MPALPDGEYVLTEDVQSPLPERLQTRRRGWMRAPCWSKDTHFIIKNGRWTCDRHYGWQDGRNQLSDRQKQRVFRAVRAHLQPWAPALPSHVVSNYAEEALDYLFAIGKITLDDVKEAVACYNVGHVLGNALEKFCEAPPAPPSQVPATPGSLRVGDVIESVGDRYVVLELVGPHYLWKGDNYRPAFTAPHEAYREPVVGHVADMLAEGLQALSRAYPHECPRCGCAVLSAASLHAADCQGAAVLGYDGNGQPVRAGDVLRSLQAPHDPDRFRVIGAAHPDSRGPCVLFEQFAGPTAPWDCISLAPGNQWRCVPASAPEHMLPAVSPITGRRAPEPVDASSLFSLD